MTGRATESSGLSRRAVVRGSAWTVPAVTVAAAAPAYAVSNTGWIDVDTGASNVAPNDDATWDYFFLGASIFLESRAVQPNELTMTVTVLPGNEFEVLDGGPPGWSQQTAGTVTSATYVYSLGVPADSGITIPDGHWFATAGGSFLITFQAPGFHSFIAQSIYVPASQVLSFDPGTSSALRVPDPAGSGPDLWTMYFEGASVRVSGGVVSDVDLLRLLVRFVPDAGFSQRQFLDTGVTPAGWSSSGAANPHQELTFSYDDVVDASGQDVVIPLDDGAFFTTMQPADQQSGYFELTVSDIDDGFASGTYRLHVPAS